MNVILCLQRQIDSLASDASEIDIQSTQCKCTLMYCILR